MKHEIKSQLWLTGLIVLATGCASADPEFGSGSEDTDLGENVATTSEAVVNGWTSWSTSSKSAFGTQVGCHNGSLVTAVQRSNYSGRIHCTQVAGSNNTESYWTAPSLLGGAGAGCPSTHQVTGYQSASWNAGSGVSLRCSRTPNLYTGSCFGQYVTNGERFDFPAGYYLKAAACSNGSCGHQYYTACRALPLLPIP